MTDMTTTSKIALTGAAMLTTIGIAVAASHGSKAEMSVDYTGMPVAQAVEQANRDGFTDAVITVVDRAEHCPTMSPNVYQAQPVSSVAVDGNKITITVKDSRVCTPPPPPPPPAPIVVAEPSVPDVIPNVPSFRSGGGKSGGESRFCRKRKWC